MRTHVDLLGGCAAGVPQDHGGVVVADGVEGRLSDAVRRLRYGAVDKTRLSDDEGDRPRLSHLALPCRPSERAVLGQCFLHSPKIPLPLPLPLPLSALVAERACTPATTTLLTPIRLSMTSRGVPKKAENRFFTR